MHYITTLNFFIATTLVANTRKAFRVGVVIKTYDI